MPVPVVLRSASCIALLTFHQTSSLLELDRVWLTATPTVLTAVGKVLRKHYAGMQGVALPSIGRKLLFLFLQNRVKFPALIASQFLGESFGITIMKKFCQMYIDMLLLMTRFCSITHFNTYGTQLICPLVLLLFDVGGPICSHPELDTLAGHCCHLYSSYYKYSL